MLRVKLHRGAGERDSHKSQREDEDKHWARDASDVCSRVGGGPTPRVDRGWISAAAFVCTRPYSFPADEGMKRAAVQFMYLALP